MSSSLASPAISKIKGLYAICVAPFSLRDRQFIKRIKDCSDVLVVEIWISANLTILGALRYNLGVHIDLCPFSTILLVVFTYLGWCQGEVSCSPFPRMLPNIKKF